MIRNEAFCPTTAVKMEKPPTQQLLYLGYIKTCFILDLIQQETKISSCANATGW